MSGNWSSALGAFMPLMLGMIGMFILCIVVLIVGIRVITKNKIICTFHKNHKKGSSLLKYDAENQCVWIGREDNPNREKYNVTQDEMEWVEWPGTLPSYFCVTLRSLDYVRGNPVPINPEKKASAVISAKALRLQSDANVLQAVYMHARQSLGLNKKQALGGIVTILLVATTALSLFGAYKIMSTGSQVTELKTQIGTIQSALGVGVVVTPTPTPGSN